ncbi:MAG: restriction endonuclease subunit S [Lactobacillus crispatus]
MLNPSERIRKEEKYRKIAMENLKPFTRDISSWSYSKFHGGTKFRNNDTLMARITPCLENGKTAFVNTLNKDEVAFGSTEFYVLRAIPGKIDPYYLYYLSVSNSFREVAIKSMTGTSGRQRVPKEMILNYCVNIPNLSTQKKIANKIKILDDKITLNNQINDNLLSIMKAYFDHFESEYEVKLSEIADISSSKRVFAKDYQNTGIPFYRGKEISKLSAGEQIKPELFISEQKFKALKDSAPLENQILITAVGTVGNIYKVENNVLPFYFKDGNIIRVNLKNKNLTNYIYLWLISQQGQEKINASLIGSTQKALTIKSVKKLSLSLPTDASLQEFNKKTSILFQEISNNKAANKILDSLRKKLLQRYF